MLERGIPFLILLMSLLIAAGCRPSEMLPQATAAMTAEAALEQEATAVRTPANTLEPAAPTKTVTAPAQQTAAASAPAVTIEPPSSEDAAQIYAAAIRQMVSVNHSFSAPGEPPEFPLVYIVSTTDDGTLLGNPATPPQPLTPPLQQAIAAELADLMFEIIWIERFSEAPMDNSTGLIADGQGIVITMGNILPQEDGTVHVPFYMVCGTLCVSGKTYVLANTDGAWQVNGSVGMEVQG